MSDSVRRGLLLALLAFVGWAPAVGADPVTDFIVEADAAFQSGGEAALAPVVAASSLLVGAAVAQLLDVAVTLREEGRASDAAENVDFAEKIAALHRGSDVPRKLVRTYEDRDEAGWEKHRHARALEAEAAELRSAGDPAAGLSRLQQARELYESIDALHEVAVLHGTMGVFHWVSGDMRGARDAYEDALAARRAVEDRILEGRTLNGLGSTHLQLGEYDRAIEFYEQARDLRRATGDLAGLGTTITYLGNTYYVLGDLVRARRCFEEAIPILEAQGNVDQQMTLLTAIANVHSDQGRTDEANAAYAEVIGLARGVGAKDDEAMARLNMAGNHRVQGRFQSALAQLDSAATAIENVEDPNLPILLHNARGATFSALGDVDRAREDFATALKLANDAGLADLELQTRLGLGYLYLSVLAGDRALALAQESIDQAAAIGAARRYRDAQALAGDAAANVGDLEAARAHWAEALAQDEADGAVAQIPLSEIGLANAEVLAGENEVARARFHRALQAVERADVGIVEWVPLLGLAHSFEADAPDSAAFYYDRALDALERQRLSDAALGTGYVHGERAKAYEGILLYFAREWRRTGDEQWLRRSFATAERSKARGLLDLVDDAASSTRIEGMEALLDSLYALPPGRESKATRFRLEERMAQLRWEATGAASAPRRGEPLSLEELQRILPRRTVLLEFALGDSASFLWVVDRKRVELVELPPRATLKPKVDRLRSAIAARGSADEVFRQEARELYVALFEPVAERLSRARALLIVPDGPLFELPFEALLTEESEANAPLRELPFLARTAATVVAPSATLWADLRARERESEHAFDLVAVGDPTYDGDLARLEFTRAEVETIVERARKGRAVALLGPEATELRLERTLRSGTPRVLHLAAHGLVDAVEPSRSCVALTPADGDDGRLHTLEIFGLPLEGSLVVLSACESARGRVQSGEGVVGLTRAFLGAGASGAVASLWPVSDASTAQLMESFYASMLGKNRTAAEALRDARRGMLEDEATAHPFHWAAFVCLGDERAPW